MSDIKKSDLLKRFLYQLASSYPWLTSPGYGVSQPERAQFSDIIYIIHPEVGSAIFLKYFRIPAW